MNMRTKFNLFLLIVLFTPLILFAVTPYVNVPGLSDDMDVEKLIEDLVEVERIPITQNENEISNYQIRTRIMEDFETYLEDLQTRSEQLYNYQSPFRDMIGESDDETILEATANRTAVESEYDIEIVQLAESDSFMSDSFSRTKVLDKANFQIIIGDETNQINFPGGTIYKLQEYLEDFTDDQLKVRTITDTKTTVVLAIEGEETGEDYSIKFDGNLTPLYEIGLLMETSEKRDDHEIDFRDVVSLTDDKILAEKSKMMIDSGDEAEIDLSAEKIAVKSATEFKFTVNILSSDEEAEITPEVTEPVVTDTTDQESTVTYKDIQLKKMDGVTVSNITVEGGSFLPYYYAKTEEEESSEDTNAVTEEPEETEETAYQVTNFTQIITLKFKSGAIKRYSITSNGSYSMSLSIYESQTVDQITFENENTDKKYVISDMEFTTLISEGGAQPQNPLSLAQNAIFKIDGIQVVRSDNNIDDVIDGVTLFLKDTTDEAITLNITHDYELIQESIADWVYSYNQAMEYLYYITKPTLKDLELYEITDEEDQREGIFQTEYTLKNLKYKLRTASMDAYDTEIGRELSLLQQIGIYTKEAGSFSAESEEWLTTQMGLLNVDLDTLAEALAENFDAVEQLFGYDSDGDYLRDTGVAYTVNNTLDLALGTGGYIDNKLDYYDDEIDDLEEENEELEEKLEEYEQTQREKFGAMQETMKEMDTMSTWFNGQLGSMSSGSGM